MEKDYRKGFARILYSSSPSESANYAGCGFLIDSQYLVTCHHVLDEAAKNIALVIGMEFTVDFPFLTKKGIRIKLIKLLERKPNPMYADLEDMALLEFIDATDAEDMQSLLPLPIDYPEMEAQDGHDIEIYSAMATNPLSGKCNRSVDKGWIATDIAKTNVQPGDSGSPVWNKNLKSITGMLVARQNANQTCYFIPTFKIRQAFAEFLKIDQVKQTTKVPFKNLVDVAKFRENVQTKLIKVFDQAKDLRLAFLEKHGLPGKTTAEELTNTLLEQIDSEVRPIIRNLSIVLRDSLPRFEENKDYQSAGNFINNAELILNSLVLFALNQTEAERFHEQLANEHLNISLPKTTPLSAEIVSANRFQCYSQHTIMDARVIGKHAYHHYGSVLEPGINHDRIVEDILCKLWIKVFPKVPVEKYNLTRLRNKIDGDLKAGDLHKKNHYLLVSICKDDKSGSPLEDAEIRRKLADKIPELPIIVLDDSQETEVYLSDDEVLEEEIYYFYEVVDAFNEKRNRPNTGPETPG